MTQQIAWQISLAIIAILLLVFLIVARSAGRSSAYEPIQRTAYRMRRIFFAMLLLIGIAVPALTLTNLPYAAPRNLAGAPLTVRVVGQQWSWQIEPDHARVGQPVMFAVTSADVNHGFALYDDKLELLAETQAMPGYINRLYYTFTMPGKYRVLCLEYCGLAHHEMVGEFTVQ